MTGLGRWFRRLVVVFRKRSVEAGMDDEMRFHVEMQTKELLAEGVEPGEAWRIAQLRFGGVERYKEEGRDARGVRRLEDLAADLRYGLRQLRRSPGFALVVVLTLGLGIGANTAVFSVVYGVMLKSLPYPEPDRVVHVGWDWNGNGHAMASLSAYKFEYWRSHNRVFAGMATWAGLTVDLGNRGTGGTVEGLRVSDDFFRVTGFMPRLGRPFSAEEQAPGGAAVAIVSDAFWRGRLGGDRSIIGQSIRLDGQSYVVVGVMPPAFAFPPSPASTSVLVPLGLKADPRDEGHNSLVIARLAPGITMAGARADMQRVLRVFKEEHADLVDGARERPMLESFREAYLGDLATTLWVLFGAVGLVLLIACANVANLLLARGTTRQRELAIRAMLGAGRGRVVRQVVSESLLLALLGGAVGLGLGALSLKLLLGLAPPITGLSAVALNGSVLLFTVAIALFTGVLFGLATALPAARPDLAKMVKEGTRTGGVARATGRARNLLVGAEAALAMMLLAGAGLLITSFMQLRNTDLGFEAANVLTLSFRRAPAAYDGNPAAIRAFERQLLERLRTVPGVVDVAATSSVPLERGMNIPMTVEGRPDATEGAVEWRAVSPDYFRTLGIGVARGRSFTDRDDANGRPVVLINEAMAELYWPDADPVGQRLTIANYKGEPLAPELGEPAREIVGVVRDVREIAPGEPARRTVYVPQTQVIPAWAGVPRFLVKRATPLTAEVLQAAVRDVDARMPAATIGNLEDRIGASLAQDRFNTLLMALFAGVALVLTAIGIYGVVAYVVRQRTAEIGIRMALGAGRADVLRSTMLRGMAPVLTGLAAGIVGALALSRFLSGMLHGVSATDPLTLAVVALVLCAVGLAATLVPAMRAAAADPMAALRVE